MAFRDAPPLRNCECDRFGSIHGDEKILPNITCFERSKVTGKLHHLDEELALGFRSRLGFFDQSLECTVHFRLDDL